jgi:hypothetical protein
MRHEARHPARKAISAVVVTAVIATACGGSDGGSLQETRPVEITGTALPTFPETGADPAVGMAVPELVGSSFDGSAVEMPDDGRPKVLLILAHW